MNQDKETTIQELKDILKKFRDDRDWKQFHNPKDLAEAISVEVGELQELFLWQDKEKIAQKLREDQEFKKKVGKELADVIIFCLNFANITDLDLSSVIKEKILINGKKYSVEKSKGNSEKYNKL